MSLDSRRRRTTCRNPMQISSLIPAGARRTGPLMRARPRGKKTPLDSTGAVLEELITIVEEAKSHGKYRPAPAGLLVALGAGLSKPAASIPNYGKPREARQSASFLHGRSALTKTVASWLASSQLWLQCERTYWGEHTASTPRAIYTVRIGSKRRKLDHGPPRLEARRARRARGRARRRAGRRLARSVEDVYLAVMGLVIPFERAFPRFDGANDS